MSEPAKDEAELMERVAEALYDNYDLDLPMSFTLTAIRAAGWVVVPVEPTEEMLDIGTSHIFQPGVTWHKCAGDVYRSMLKAAPGVKP